MFRFENMAAISKGILIVIFFAGLTHTSRAQDFFRNFDNITALVESILNISSISGWSASGLFQEIVKRQGASSLFIKSSENNTGTNITAGNSTENQCTADLSLFLSGIMKKEMWALKMVDAAGKPRAGLLKGAKQWVGDYDECLDVEHTVSDTSTSAHVIKGNYCKLFLPLPSFMSSMMSSRQQASGNVPNVELAITWHVCFPSSCDEEKVGAAFNKALQMFNMTLKRTICRVPKEIGKDNRAIAALVVLSLIAALSLLGTGYDVMIDGRKRHKLTISESEGHIGPALTLGNDKNFTSADGEDTKVIHMQILSIANGNATETASKSPVEESLGRKVLLSFSILKNTEKIFSTETTGGNLGCFHGIRVLSMSWVIIGHTVMWGSLGLFEVVNPLGALGLIKSFTFQPFITASLSVDSFFLMSGCLVAYLFLRETKKRGKITCRQMALYYAHRYWRLTPIYMIALMFFTCIAFYLTEGPLESPMASREYCYNNWWINLLYINNIYKTKQECFSWSWFLANDMQFYMVAPLALVPLALGFQVIGLLVISAFIATQIITYAYFDSDIGGSLIHASPRYMPEVYKRPYCRIGVFAIGVALGYLLHKTNCKMKIPRVLLLIGWQIAIGVALTCTYITYNDVSSGIPQWGKTEVAVHETLFRPGWALALSWIVLVCCTGYGGIVNSILSWKAWIPLGRLTYGAYLVHPIVLFVVQNHNRAPFYFDTFTLSYQFMGCVMLSYAAAYILSVLVEAPCLGLERAVLRK